MRKKFYPYCPLLYPEFLKSKKPHLGDNVNRTKLRAILAARGITQAQAAAACGKDETLINDKLAGRKSFKVGDIQFFKEYLNLPTAEAIEIFFGATSI